MNTPQDEQLDHLLRMWARDHSRNEEHLDALQQQIRQRMDSDTDATADVPSRVRGNGRRVGFAAGLAAAAVLLALIGAGAFLSREPVPNAIEVAHSEVEPTAAGWSEHIREQTELLARCQELFNGRLAWIVGSGSDSAIELIPSDSDVHSAQFVTIRLRLVSRKVGTDTWTDLQTIDVLASQEEWVELSADALPNSQVSLWTYPIDSQVVSVDLLYRSNSLPGKAITISSLQRMSQPTIIRSFEEQGIEYRLYQIADVIPLAKSGKSS